LQHELAQAKRDLADAAPKVIGRDASLLQRVRVNTVLQAQRCLDAEKASQADELKAAAAAIAADAASNAAREAKDTQRQLQQELHDEQRRCALLSQDVEYLRQATARLESSNTQLRDKCERQSARIQKLKAHEEELQVSRPS
jgi:predicted RNase H-like nuclease (RuvC/YqgF family)